METKELNLKEIQQQNLKVLSKIDEICRKENIKYFLAYGTLLGAIRHNGFIPWDDDVDVMMPRKDYLKFKKYYYDHKEELKPFKLCTRENTENYEYYLPRFVNMDYKYINLLRKKPQMDIGTFVDIYPIDNYGNDDSAKKVFNKIKMKNAIYGIYLTGISPTSKFKTLIMFPLHIIQRIVKGKNYQYRVNKEIDDLILKSFSDSDRYVGIPSWTFNFKQYKREWLEDHIEKDFEGKKFYVPKFYEDILKMEYGDYMKLPPEDQRKPYHGYKIVKREK